MASCHREENQEGVEILPLTNMKDFQNGRLLERIISAIIAGVILLALNRLI